jgi:hypothetical protein
MMGGFMSYPPAPPGSYQIDVVDEVSRAYSAVLNNLQLVGEMALIPYLFVIAAELLILLIPGAGFLLHVLAALIEALVMLIFGTVFIVRWHRFILLGEAVGDGLIPPGWTTFLIAGIKLGAAIFVGWIVLVVIALLPPHFITVPLSIIGGLVLALLSLRVSLIFPAAAIEHPISMHMAWDWIAGNYWRLFACALACYLPFIIVEMVIGLIGAAFPSFATIIFEALRLAVSFVGAAVVATLLSHLYAQIAGNMAPATA